MSSGGSRISPRRVRQLPGGGALTYDFAKISQKLHEIERIWENFRSVTGQCQMLSKTLSVADPGFSPGGAPTPKIAIIFHIFAENCMKMKEFGPPGGGARPWRPPPLDPPMTVECRIYCSIWGLGYKLVYNNVRCCLKHCGM